MVVVNQLPQPDAWHSFMAEADESCRQMASTGGFQYAVSVFSLCCASLANIINIWALVSVIRHFCISYFVEFLCIAHSMCVSLLCAVIIVPAFPCVSSSHLHTGSVWLTYLLTVFSAAGRLH